MKSENVLCIYGVSNVILKRKFILIMKDINETIKFPTLFFPNGTRVPLVLTSQEVIHLLRLDVDGPKAPDKTLEYYREKKLLRGMKIGQNLRYYLPDVLEFIAQQSDWTNRNQNIS